MAFLKRYKLDGTEVVINDHPANQLHAMQLGWTEEPPAKRAAPQDEVELDSRGLPWDERINTKNQSRDDAGHWKYKSGVTADMAGPIEQELALQVLGS